jgi:hypothetical protein
LKKRSFSLLSKIATAVVSWSSVSAWLLTMRSYSSRIASISLLSTAIPAEPSPPA